jgi:hypothetical protein
MKHFVVCGNMSEYKHYLIENKLVENKLDYRLCAYVSSIDSIRGTRNPKGIFTGTWWNRKDIVDIVSTLTAAGADADQMRKALDCYYSKIDGLYHD